MHFNPRTREGCDVIKEVWHTSTASYFNPRTREGCDSAPQETWGSANDYFNPRTREGCDMGKLRENNGDIWISIHAPVKGATAV